MTPRVLYVPIAAALEADPVPTRVDWAETASFEEALAVVRELCEGAPRAR